MSHSEQKNSELTKDAVEIEFLQLGTGRFLRAFVDRFAEEAREAGQSVGSIAVVQSTEGTRATSIAAQPSGFHVLVRGFQHGDVIDRVQRVQTIAASYMAKNDWPELLRLIARGNVRTIVSNATESGYKLDSEDRFSDSPPRSLPAKLTQLLLARYETKAMPLQVIPCELIERNAEKLQALVLEQIELWKLPESFRTWVVQDCLWLCNLVDCIVTDGPADHPLAATDQLLACAEPYALWAIEKPKGRSIELFSHPAIQWVDDLSPFYLRKVRMLNGLHSAMVAKFLPAGFQTVQQVMKDPKAVRWIRDLLFEEIVPTLAYRLEGVAQFADDVLDRFRNPFQNHKLADIQLNHQDKVKVRLQPTLEEYQKLFGRVPARLHEVLQVNFNKS
jgi:tagaturonate reductase